MQGCLQQGAINRITQSGWGSRATTALKGHAPHIKLHERGRRWRSHLAAPPDNFGASPGEGDQSPLNAHQETRWCSHCIVCEPRGPPGALCPRGVIQGCISRVGLQETPALQRVSARICAHMARRACHAVRHQRSLHRAHAGHRERMQRDAAPIAAPGSVLTKLTKILCGFRRL